MTRTTLFALVLAFTAIQSAPARDVRAGATSSPTSKTALPVECEAFLHRVDRCMQTLGPDNPIASAYKQRLDLARSEWQSADQAVVANVCHLASEAFDKIATNAHCEPREVAVVTP